MVLKFKRINLFFLDFKNNFNLNNTGENGGGGGGTILNQFSYPPPQYTAPNPPNQAEPLPNKISPTSSLIYPSPNCNDISETPVPPSYNHAVSFLNSKKNFFLAKYL